MSSSVLPKITFVSLLILRVGSCCTISVSLFALCGPLVPHSTELYHHWFAETYLTSFLILLPERFHSMSPPYSVIVPGTVQSESGSIRRNPLSQLVNKLSLHGNLTLYETFNAAIALHAHRPCLADRPIDSVDNTPGLYMFRTYAEVGTCVKYIASGLVKEGLLQAPSNPDGILLLGLFLKNCSAWVIAEQACYRQGAVTIPLYDTFGVDTLSYIIQQTGLATILCSTKELSMLAEVSKMCPTLKTIVVTDASRLSTSVLSGTLLRLITWNDLLSIGESNSITVLPHPPSPIDVATICYTSGTTGKPKGAIISHQNLVTVCAAGLDSCLHIRNDDMYLSFLPLPHIFERIVVNSLLACGAAIGFYRGDPLKIIEDVIALKPTVFCAVPRLYNRIYDKINQKVTSSTGLSGKMLRVAVTTKLKNLKQHKLLSHSIWDPLVFDKIKLSLGMNRVRILLSGGAPLPLATMDFFRILLGAQCSCHEGYGQTETTGATSLTMTGDFTPSSHVGGPFPCCDIKLVDVAEMNYFHTDTWHDEKTPCQGTFVNGLIDS